MTLWWHDGFFAYSLMCILGCMSWRSVSHLRLCRFIFIAAKTNLRKLLSEPKLELWEAGLRFSVSPSSLCRLPPSPLQSHFDYLSLSVTCLAVWLNTDSDHLPMWSCAAHKVFKKWTSEVRGLSIITRWSGHTNCYYVDFLPCQQWAVGLEQQWSGTICSCRKLPSAIIINNIIGFVQRACGVLIALQPTEHR